MAVPAQAGSGHGPCSAILLLLSMFSFSYFGDIMQRTMNFQYFLGVSHVIKVSIHLWTHADFGLVQLRPPSR